MSSFIQHIILRRLEAAREFFPGPDGEDLANTFRQQADENLVNEIDSWCGRQMSVLQSNPNKNELEEIEREASSLMHVTFSDLPHPAVVALIEFVHRMKEGL